MTSQQNAPDQSPSFIVKGQYIKDLSFENPNSPHSLFTTGSQPDIKVGFDLKAEKVQDDVYETTLHITVRAKADGSTLFLADLVYAGIFHLSNIPADRIDPLLMVDAPFVLFPFARRVISDLTRDGGFPPLMLDPIDFHSLYLQKRGLS